ncbi:MULTISPECIES: ABC transporter ATP-binding protein [Peptoniphilus]|uniref:ABC transporter ATP-binding protein n=1 Tax=Peptoniphilus TaxID=162289 RepID=UPI0001DA9D05|nr:MULTISPECIES: ABC transporter ATP-binding protein [Peptoniphilus]EFI42477.1 ABC transporter, ATP-binding protein [Peptoniphilus sp. oral taxon 386 str. F0131]
MINTLKKIWEFAGEERKNISQSVFLGFVFAVFHMLQISAIYFVIDGLIKGEKSLKISFIAFMLLVISIIGRASINYFTQLKQTHAGYFMVANKRIEIGNRLKSVPMGYFNKTSIGEIIGINTTVLDDVETLAPMILVAMLSGFINSVVFTIMILLFEWKIGILVVMGTAIYLVITSKMEKRSRTLLPKRQKAQAKLVEAVLEQIQGMHIIKAFNLTGKGDKKVRRALENSRSSNLSVERVFTPYIMAQSISLNIFSVLMIIVSVSMYLNGTMTLTNAIMCIIMSFMVFTQISSTGSSLATFRIVSSSIEQAEKINEIPQMDIDGKEIIPESHDIEFRNVSFSYEKKKILDNISIKLPGKTMTAIVGPSGSGKTTMCNLIARFWDVDEGSITIGGRDIKEYTLESLMEQISMVFQNVYLFQDTVENNIRFGKPDATHEQVIEAAKKACCHDFIMGLPNGYNTIIGEGGGSLSGGEKQRISIARAILKDSPIIIFDEATANIDPENEHKLQSAIEELTKNKTIIMIAHRLKTVRNANQILVVNNGRIEEIGTHEELIKQDGIYSKFINSRKEAVGWKI